MAPDGFPNKKKTYSIGHIAAKAGKMREKFMSGVFYIRLP
jgi:hypothetical protein